MIGQVLSGNYRLTDLVGSGGYADVYLARDLRTNTIVAVKILHAHVARDPDVAARFEREASFARRLQTPYVARVLDAGQDPTTPPFMVMEFVQGLTVAELIRRNGPFSIPEAVEIADQLLSALASAHALGIIHRDIKPQNLMIDAERRLKVLDFGVARLAGAGTMTASGHLLGTPEYMASEQVDGRPVDHRTDLYAAGAVLYQLLTGRPPYLRDATSDIWELIRRVRAESPPPIRQLRPDCPPALAAVVERAMAKEPARRYQSALEMRQALAAAMGTAPTPPPATRIMGAPPMGQSPPFQHPPVPSPAGQSPAGPYSPGAPTPGPYLPGPYGPGPAAPGPYPPRQGTGGPFTPSPPVPPSPGPANGGGGMPAWKIAGLAAGALVLIVLGVAVGRMVPLPGASTPTPTALAAATPTRAAPTATSGAAKVSSPAAEGTSQARSPVPSPTAPIAVNPTSPPKPTAPPTPPPSPTVPPKPTLAPGVLLADNFDRPEIGQLRRESARPNDYTFAYEAGEYVIRKINATLPTAPIVFLPGSYDNSVIAVDTRLMGNVASRYTFVVCRDQSTDGQAKQYRASLVPEERRLILSRWDAGTQRVLAEARDDPAIQPGSAKNRLELRCAGAKISASVNGRVVASADDLTLNRGDHGLGTGTFQGVDGTIEARFDNLEVRSP